MSSKDIPEYCPHRFDMVVGDSNYDSESACSLSSSFLNGRSDIEWTFCDGKYDDMKNCPVWKEKLSK